MKFVTPTVCAKGYTCPHCGVLAEQSWWGVDWDGRHFTPVTNNDICVGFCKHCGDNTLWISERMCYPSNAGVEPSNSEMPKRVRALYEEAANIATASPRGAAALLRLAIQLLCKELGGKGENINNDIGELVKKGLPPIVQQSLDIVRVTGNNAVHPGQIDVDDGATCGSLFNLINVIVEYMIAMPKRVSGLYAALPASAHKQIEKRDSSAKSSAA